jgi:hypothetical protein
LKKKPNRTETGRFDPVSVFLGQKSVQTGLARFFQFWLGFSGLARFFRFGSVFFLVFVGFVSVRFSFLGFLLIKPNPNRTGRFF